MNLNVFPGFSLYWCAGGEVLVIGDLVLVPDSLAVMRFFSVSCLVLCFVGCFLSNISYAARRQDGVWYVGCEVRLENVVDFDGPVLREVSNSYHTYDVIGYPGSLSDDEAIWGGYYPSYSPKSLNGGLYIGFAFSLGMMVELELSRLSLSLNTEGFGGNYRASYLELVRSGTGFLGVNNPNDNSVSGLLSALDGESAVVKLWNSGLDSSALLLSFVYQILPESIMRSGIHRREVKIIPYVSVGLGMARVSFLDNILYSFAYKGAIGIAYRVSKNIDLKLGLHYISVPFGNETEIAPIYDNFDLVVNAGHAERAPYTGRLLLDGDVRAYGLDAGISVYF